MQRLKVGFVWLLVSNLLFASAFLTIRYCVYGGVLAQILQIDPIIYMALAFNTIFVVCLVPWLYNPKRNDLRQNLILICVVQTVLLGGSVYLLLKFRPAFLVQQAANVFVVTPQDAYFPPESNWLQRLHLQSGIALQWKSVIELPQDPNKPMPALLKMAQEFAYLRPDEYVAFNTKNALQFANPIDPMLAYGLIDEIKFKQQYGQSVKYWLPLKSSKSPQSKAIVLFDEKGNVVDLYKYS